LEPEEVVLGGGNVKKLKEPPPGVRFGGNANAFIGGFRLWDATPGWKRKNRKEQIRGRPSMERAGSAQ